MDTTLVKLANRLMALGTCALIEIAALKNWRLHHQIRKLEARLGLRSLPR